MTEKLSFKEYCLSKKYLRLAVDNVPRIMEYYELTKYCKFPVVSEDDDKQYVGLKPKDRLEVVWECLNPESPTLKSLKVIIEDDTETVQPAWSNSKLSAWLKNNTRKTK
jgi:hypothetical protein